MPSLAGLQWSAVIAAMPLLQEDTGVSLGVLMLLIVAGLGLIVAEVFFPSFGVLSVLAATALISAVFLAFQKGQFFGFVFLAIAAIGAPAMIYLGLRWLPDTPVGKRLLLAAPDREAVTKAAEEPGLHGFLNKTGVAVSALRPAGYARIDGRRVDVVTRGELIDTNCPIRVVEVEGNRVVVAELSQPAAGGEPNTEKLERQEG